MSKLLAQFFILANLFFSFSQGNALLVSVKALGMGEVGVAYPQDALAAAFNPAGMVDIEDRVDVGATWVQTFGHTTTKGNLIPGANGKFNAFRTKNSFSGDFGINKRVGCEKNVAIGLVAYNRAYSKTTFNTSLNILGNTKAGLEYIHQTISPGVAIKALYGLSFGVTLDFHIQRFKVDGLQNFDSPFLSSAPGYVTNNKYAYSTGVGLSFGAKWDITEEISAGFAYAPKTSMRRFHNYKGVLAEHAKVNIPERIEIGFKYRFLPCATFALDVEHLRWKKVKVLANPLLNSGGTLNTLGLSNGPGFGWGNQTFLRSGLDFQLSEAITLRGGYVHITRPIRSSQTLVNELTVQAVQNVATVGATYAISACQEISFCYLYAFKDRIKGRNSVPDFLGGGEIDLTQRISIAGISWGYQF